MAQKKSPPLPEFLADLPERFPKTRKYLVAVSGGRDSVALLHILLELGYRKLVLVHLNHRLRGREAAGDARYVKALGKRLDLPVEAASEDVGKLARVNSCSIETAAREARHRFFFEAAARQRCRRLFLGHHADDQAETVLMHLCRGSGVRGLAGMQESMFLHREGIVKPLEVIRPLLGVRRASIDSFLTDRRLAYREDASNRCDDHVRNRVRNTLMPELCKTFGRDVAPMLHRLSTIIADEDTLLDQFAHEALDSAKSGTQLSVVSLKLLPIALQRRVLQLWLDRWDLRGIGFHEIESIRTLLTQRDPAKVNLPGDRHVRRRAGVLFVE